ncbi:hypothetical protein PFICI_00679 [Pestalotiopsis fici W106-1]|uniref:Ubiquitin-like domain-containing protein n=1 Tax=Pestalotiopsis fici (strain W106-1 / CGMCC3.15140) TaxID=1229662 RepID=W3XNL6_PESFW|nr:uncharacterized protein PFICI_00679 [Pestalotiopsis fici W106-1]ETS86851.1 hypothetical protein PFICI_00679 [Pestalotiopsis fici W106-1]
MGCCFSRPGGPNAPYPGGAPSTSSRAINSPRLQPAAAQDGSSGSLGPAAQSERLAPHASIAETSRRRRDQRPLDQHIDKKLRWHVWTAKNRAWTRAQLDKERQDFFDTRVTGRPEVWQTVHAALRELWEADLAINTPGASGETDVSPDDSVLSVAQGILRAVEITLPTGDLANGVYDSLGQYYALPEWIVRDPVNITVEDKAEAQGEHKGELGTGDESSEEIGEEEALRRREEKGKAVVDSKTTTKIRIRISETARDIIVRVGPDERVRSIAQRALQQSGLDPSTRRVRLVYLGKTLKEDATLESQGHNKDHIINAFINNRQA